MSEFAQNVILLLITAALSGLLVPVITSRIQDRNARRAKIQDASLLRQSKVIEQQENLVVRLSDLLWEFQLAAIGPLYYGQFLMTQDSILHDPTT